MMKHLVFLLFLAPQLGYCQIKVLHYTETSGFDHGTRAVSLQMFQDIGLGVGFTVDDDQTGDAFNSLSNLEEYDVVMFSNTSGNNILDATQRANFEAYINNGGSYLGIHAATDTYRHSTANGGSTGTWDFYAELVGASVQQNPNHVAGTPQYEMTHINPHNSTANIPNPWVKNEEYYYWENGYFGNNNTVVLEVEETIGPNNMVNSYDAPRPMSWYRNLSGGGGMFYTALGHATSNFTSDANFYTHIYDAMFSLLTVPTSIAESEKAEIQIQQNGSELTIALKGNTPERLSLFDMLGREMITINRSGILNTEKLPAGLYLLKASDGKTSAFRKVYLN
jgi:type 1 glutamine amidotransferase